MNTVIVLSLLYAFIAGYFAQMWVINEFGSTCSREDLLAAYILGWLWLPIHGLYKLCGWRR